MADPSPPRQSWFVITPDDEDQYDIFRVIPEIGTQALYSISPTDMAAAVPTIKIWKLVGAPNLRTNKKIEPPISDQFTALPDFGKPTGRFGERPAASIESVTVKKVNPGGWIMYRELDLAITVHRPDVLNEAQTDGNVIVSLLQPGNSFVMEYGWRGGKNSILGPGASHKETEREHPTSAADPQPATFRPNRQLPDTFQGSGASVTQLTTLAHNLHSEIAAKRPPPAKREFFGTTFTAVQSLRFSVVNYTFSILPDNQVRFNIHCIEDGELEIRNTTIFEQPDLPRPASGDAHAAGAYLEEISGYFAAQLRDLSFTEAVSVTDPKGNPGQTKVAEEEFIELQDVLNVLFAMPIVRAVGQLGYGHIHLYTGVFNDFAPKTNASMGGREWDALPIGNFWLRLKDVQKIVNDVVHNKQQITVYNMLVQVLGLISGPAIYELDAANGTSVPEMQVFTLFDPKASYARIQIVDRKRYLTNLRSLPDQTNEVNLHAKKEAIRKNLTKFLQANHMPRFTLFHQSSFFKDARFEVVNDELMKSIFLNRQVQRSREQVTAGDPRQIDAASGIPQDLLMYRSAVKGTVTVIGNFVYDLLGQVWVSFGIPALDGIFYILSKVDKVDRDGFYSTLTLQAEGSNPLGAGAPAPQVAEDFVKLKIAEAAGGDFVRYLVQQSLSKSDAATLDAEAQQTLTPEARASAVGARQAPNQSTSFDPTLPISGPGATKR